MIIRALFVLLVSTIALAGPQADAQLRPRSPIIKPAAVTLQEFHRRDVIQVKFNDGLNIRLREGQLTDFGTGALAAAQPLLRQQRDGRRWQRLIDVPEHRVDAIRQTAQANLGRVVADMNLEFILWLAPGEEPEPVIDAFNALDAVELAQPVPLPAPPPVVPDFQANQGYLNAAPDGIGAYFGWNTLEARGEGVRVVDIEYAFNANHVDLPPVTIIGPPPHNPFGDNDHGTAVLGQLGALDDGEGVTGIVPEASFYFAGAHTNGFWSVANAIYHCINSLEPGDVILIEQQQFGPSNGNYVPVEWLLSEYNAIVAAVGNGIHVVEAAGNGGENLDAAIYSTGNGGHWPFLAENDSGAIIVGAGAAPAGFGGSASDRSRLWFSCHGSRVNVQGWGERVWTTGYGGAYQVGGINFLYTGTFSGTSSASPIVAGAVAMLQSIAHQSDGGPIPPALMREALIATGTPQQGTAHIGPRPNVAEAVNYLGSLAPENDTCSGAIEVAEGQTAFSNQFANTTGPDEPGECLFFGDTQVRSDVWFTHVAQCTGELTIDLCDATINTKVAVYDGCPSGPGEALACDLGGCWPRAKVTLPVVTGQTLKIRVGGHGATQGSGMLNITCTTPLACPGDLDDNGTVSVSDLLVLLNSWGPCPGCAADLNDDGTVNVADMLILLGAWGDCP